MKATTIHTFMVCFAVGAGTLAGLVARAADAPSVPQEAPAQAATEEPAANPIVSPAVAASGSGIVLNFRGAPLETVLDYLSKATDFVINIAPGTDVRGRVDVLSSKPLSKDEAFNLLATVLNQNGLTAIRNGRMLTIKAREGAKTDSNLPVQVAPKSEEIPSTDQMMTYIIPVHYANVLQLVKDLQPLLPSYATLTANESANSLVLTDTQADIRRMTEIVNALDTSISSISTVRVFPLKYADAKQLADAVTQLFQSPTSQQNNASRINQFFRRGGGFPGFGAFGGGGQTGGGDQSQGAGDNLARQVASRVVAIGDDRTNALIISAPDEYIPTIEQLVRDIDVSATDLTEVRVFRLVNADPQETVDELTQLFPDQTKSGQNTQGQQFQFRGGRGGPFFNQSATSQTATTDRMKKMGQVVAVADQRTSSIIVSAAGDLMPQIANMIAELDASASGHQKAYVVPLNDAEVDDVMQVLQALFPSMNGRNNVGNTSTLNSALSQRQQNNSSQMGRNTGTMTGSRGSSGLGGSTGF